LRLLLCIFWIQLALQLIWALYLSVLRFLNFSHVEDGFIIFYVIGISGWIVTILALLNWMLQRYRLRMRGGGGT
jgi:hypothetical protein